MILRYFDPNSTHVCSLKQRQRMMTLQATYKESCPNLIGSVCVIYTTACTEISDNENPQNCTYCIVLLVYATELAENSQGFLGPYVESFRRKLNPRDIVFSRGGTTVLSPTCMVK